MKKCILIGALAALMLFAFTACDNQVQTFRIVDTISLVQSSAVVEGTAADASDFTVTLVYTDGTSAQVSGVGYVTVTGDKATASVTNAYGRKIESAPVSVEKSVVTSVEFSGVESISVVTGTTISKMDDVTIEADEDNFAIAFAYDGGSEVLPLSETVFALYDSNGNLVTKAGAVGEVYDVDDQTLAHLDELESYFGEDCQNNEYNKIYMDILDNDGKVKDQAYVYEFNMYNPMNVNLLGKDILEHDYVQYMQKKKLNSQNLFDDEDMFY